MTDDDLRKILGDDDYEELSKKIDKFNPDNLTDDQLLSIKSKQYKFGFDISGDDAMDLMLSYGCALRNGCEDCGLYLTDFMRTIVMEINYTMLAGVDDE